MRSQIQSDQYLDITFEYSDIENSYTHRYINDMLNAIRSHLGMDIAFVSEFKNGMRKFHYVSSIYEDSPIVAGDSDPLEESYCQRVIDGRLPELIYDALLEPAALELSVTKSLPVRSHLSVPIYLSDGTLYGTFCCFSTSISSSTLDDRDLAIMRTFAGFAGMQIEKNIKIENSKKGKRLRIKSVIDNSSFYIHYQPVINVKESKIVGFESLSRFSEEPYRSPDIWFNEANEVGLGEELELAAIGKALLALNEIPDNIYLALNSSPEHIISGEIGRILENSPLERIVLEVTEHSIVSNYKELADMLTPLRKRGLRFAVDDTGAGYASFRHILQLKPDIIKLDMSIIRDIDTDPNKHALATAIIGFALQIGMIIVAEGVESESELNALTLLGVSTVQGYLLGKPGEISTALDLYKSF